LVKHCMQHLSLNKSEPSLLRRPLSSKAPSAGDDLDKQLKDIVGSWASDVKMGSVLEAFEQRMAQTNEGQERQFARMSEIKSPPRVTEDSKVRLMHGITCLCHPRKELALFVKPDNQQMEVPAAKTAMPMLKALTHRPQLVTDFPCEDAFERVCVLQLLHQQRVVQLFAGSGSLAGG